LDYGDHFPGCKIITIEPEGWKYWERGDALSEKGKLPINVQFCKLRGRINNIFECLNPGERYCFEEQGKDKKGTSK